MDFTHFPSSADAFMSLAGLPEDDNCLEIELSTEIQRLKNYEPYIFRLSLSPLIDTCMQTVNAEVHYSTNQLRDEEPVALLNGMLLSRPNPNFHMDADSYDRELSFLSSMFYNNNGNFSRLRNPDLVEIASRPGGFLWIEKVEVEPDHKGSDLGLQLLTETFKFLRDKWTLTVIQPQPLSSSGAEWPENASPNYFDSSQSLPVLKLRRYFSRLGFVQAGPDADTSCAMYLPATVFFPSNGNTLTWKTKQDVTETDFPSLERHTPHGLDMQVTEIIYHQAIPSLLNPHPFPLSASQVNTIRGLLSAGASVHGSRALYIAAEQGADVALLRLLVNYGGDVNAPDESGNRPLHEAAREISPSVLHLVELGANRSVTNINNETPFDLLELSARSEQACVSSFDHCKPKPCTQHMRNLGRAMIALIPEKLKSQLIDGCLSPRLHVMMLNTSLHASAMVRDTTRNIYKNEEQMPLKELIGYILFLEYLPVDVLRRNKESFPLGFFIGWKQVFNAIALCLDRKKVPTVERIRQILDSSFGTCDALFEAGGKIEYAIDAVICEAGIAFQKEDIHWTCEIYPDVIDTLVCTPLDDLFNVVRAMCFHGCESPPHGPYKSSADLMYD